MSKSEKFIQDYTRNGSNQMVGWNNGEVKIICQPWLSPDCVRKALEIQFEEICEYIRDNLYGDMSVEEFIKKMKEEIQK